MSRSILDLPPELKGEIGKYLGEKDLARMSIASSQLSVVDLSELRLYHILERIHDYLQDLLVLQSIPEYMDILYKLESYILMLRKGMKTNPSMNIEFKEPIDGFMEILPMINMIDNAIEFETRKVYALQQYDTYPGYTSAVDMDKINRCIYAIHDVLNAMDEARFMPNPKKY